MSKKSYIQSGSKGGINFRTTHWSLIAQAVKGKPDSVNEALNELCRRYWFPLYAFARRKGSNEHDAQDNVQGFFAKLLEKGYVQAADRTKGRFRTFILHAFKGFLANEWDRTQTLKRGGGAQHLQLDWCDVEEQFQSTVDQELAPDLAFDRHWAASILDRVYSNLEKEYERAGKRDRYNHLKPYLLNDPDQGAYARAAEIIGLSESGIRSSVMRLRQRFGQLLHEEVADTVSEESDLQGEMRHLLAALTTS